MEVILFRDFIILNNSNIINKEVIAKLKSSISVIVEVNKGEQSKIWVTLVMDLNNKTSNSKCNLSNSNNH